MVQDVPHIKNLIIDGDLDGTMDMYRQAAMVLKVLMENLDMARGMKGERPFCILSSHIT